jgi:hypothetical protein
MHRRERRTHSKLDAFMITSLIRNGCPTPIRRNQQSTINKFCNTSSARNNGKSPGPSIGSSGRMRIISGSRASHMRTQAAITRRERGVQTTRAGSDGKTDCAPIDLKLLPRDASSGSLLLVSLPVRLLRSTFIHRKNLKAINDQRTPSRHFSRMKSCAYSKIQNFQACNTVFSCWMEFQCRFKG